MPKNIIKEYTIYQYDELSESAKEKAKKWLTESDWPFDDWYDDVYEYFKETELEPIGINANRMSFSGFYSQGDGANIVDAEIDLPKLIKHLYHNKPKERKHLLKLVKIDALQFNIGYKRHGYSNYDLGFLEYEINYGNNQIKRIENLVKDFYMAAYELLKEINMKLYKELEKSYEGYFEDEYIVDNMAANEYTFLENGERFSE